MMMDILEPKLVWVEGRCYRFCDESAWSQGKELGSYQEETYEPDYGSNDEESCDASIEIVRFRGNRYKHSFHVNRYLNPKKPLRLNFIQRIHTWRNFLPVTFFASLLEVKELR